MAAETDRQRGGRTVRGMVPSMAVVLLAAGVIYLFVPHDENVDPVKPVGYKVELASARRAAPYPVLAPEGLSREWRATSVTYDAGGPKGSAWHLGFITPDTQYAAVEQSDEARTAAYVDDVTQGARKTTRTARVGGRLWTRYEGGKYDALVQESGSGSDGKSGGSSSGGADHGGHAGGRHTTVVTGTASFQQLERLAAALRPGRGEAGGARRH